MMGNSNSNTKATSSTQESEAAASSCAICLEAFDDDALNKGGGQCVTRVKLPCCHVQTSSMQFCFRCIQLYCQQAQPTNSCKCPRCNQAYIQINPKTKTVIQVAAIIGNCRICLQQHELTSNCQKFCAACEIGISNQLRYECSSCHGHQRIPHPMYRYQPSPDEFGTATWACHLGCRTYSHWKIAPEDVPHVPINDAPESWGLRQQRIEAIRQLRRAEM